jgi:hypothetical protein
MGDQVGNPFAFADVIPENKEAAALMAKVFRLANRRSLSFSDREELASAYDAALTALERTIPNAREIRVGEIDGHIKTRQDLLDGIRHGDPWALEVVRVWST